MSSLTRTPNALASLLESAISARSTLLGRATHTLIIKNLQPHIPSFLHNHLINFYSKLDLPNSALLSLSLTPSPSVVSFTSLISGLVQNGHFTSSLTHFTNMLRLSIFPNDFTFPCVLKASATLRNPITGKQLHGVAIKVGLDKDIFVGCSVFDMYGKTGLGCDAMKVFDEMPDRNVAMWNAYISNSVLERNPRHAIFGFVEFLKAGGGPNEITFCGFLNACSDMIDLLVGRQLHGFVIRYGYIMNVSVCNGLIDFYGKCKRVEEAEMIFRETCERNAVSWCSMIAAYVQNDEEEKACVTFLRARKEGIVPSDFMVSSALSACAGLSGLELGRSVHALAVKGCIEGNIFVASSLVDMYGKSGSIEDAERAFDEMPERNLVSWNAMIGGYAHQGYADMALSLFEEMTCGLDQVVPNYVTLVCVLTACSRAGAVKVGMEIFESMRWRYRIEPGTEHYACVADMLGRAGLVERAYEFIKMMPICPSISVWGALLNACRVYGKPKLGKIAAENLFELDPQDPGNHVLLSNMFAAAGRWEEATLVRKKMENVGIKKNTGCSWVTIKNEMSIRVQASPAPYSGASQALVFSKSSK
ncbi:Pentatricopeptide repeat, partial [Dillenia turbinata]